MASSRAHLTALPRGFIAVRILQLLFTIAILGLLIFMITEDANYPQFIVLITAIITLIPSLYITLSTYRFPRAYNYWAILALEIFTFLAWFDGVYFSLGTSAGMFRDENGCRYMWSDKTQDFETTCKVISNWGAHNAAANGVFGVIGLAGALVILWGVSLVVVSVFIARFRRGVRGERKGGAGEGEVVV